MHNDKFMTALKEVMEEEYGLLLGNTSEHEFLPGFEKKMDRLIKRQKKFYFPVIRIGIRKTFTIIIIAVIMMFGAVMSVGAWRNAFFSFVTKPFKTHTLVTASETDTAPVTIEEIKQPAFIPEGFAPDETYLTKELCNIVIYTNGIDSFNFEQWVKSEYDQSINTEGYDIRPVTVNDCEGFSVSMDDVGMNFLSWDSGDYIFQIVGSINIDTMLKIASSVQ